MAEQTTVVGGEALKAALKDAGRLGIQALRQGLKREAETIMRISKKEHVPVDMGILKTSGYVAPIEETPTSVTVTLGYGGAAQAYALYVHEGTGPAVGKPAFMPPTKALLPWAKRHGITKTDDEETLTSAEKSALFGLARAIGQRGLAPLKYLERPLLEAISGMDTRLAEKIKERLAKSATRGKGTPT